MDTRTGQVFEATTEDLNVIRKAMDPSDTDRFQPLEFKPNPDCKRCKGGGTIKSWGTKYKYGACPKCYPDHPQKAASFKQHLKSLSTK